MTTFEDIVAAQHRIKHGVLHLPCQHSEALSALCGANIYAKREYLQRTGSFKERGARNALMLLTPEQRKAGVVAASAGNHALALAYHGRELGIPVTVVMPLFSPLVKQSRCRGYGATVELFGDNIGEAKIRADALVDSFRYAYIHGFDAPEVIAGAGTIGLEILSEVPNLDAIVVPIGGGGLIAGIAVAVKTLNPNVKVIGVEPENAASYMAACASEKPVRVEVLPTLGDGLAVPEIGAHAFSLARPRVDSCVTVDEHTIALSILRLLELDKGVVEGAGAVPLAAFLAGKLPELAGKNVALILCGGNIDPAVLGRVIETGLVADGRLINFRATISDRPGGLAEFTLLMAEAGASIRQVNHERAFTRSNFSRVDVYCVAETRDHSHAALVIEVLRSAGMECSFV